MNIRKLKADLDWFVIRNTPWLPITALVAALFVVSFIGG